MKEIIQKYQNGQSINSLAEEYKMSWDRIRRILEEGGAYKKGIKRNQHGVVGTNKSLFDSINSEEDAYWLGMLYADGSVRESRNEIALDIKDKDVIEKFKTYVGRDNQVRTVNRKYKDGIYTSYAYSFSDAKTKQNLIKLGCVPKKTTLAECPNENQVPTQWFKDFLRGLVDGDGYFQYDPSQRKYRLMVVGTEALCKGLANRLQIEGQRVFKQTTSNAWYYEIGRKIDVEKILTEMYENATIFLDRKKERYEDIKKNWA